MTLCGPRACRSTRRAVVADAKASPSSELASTPDLTKTAPRPGPGQAAAPESQPLLGGTRLRLAAEPGVSADPAGLTARTRPEAKPETRAANPRSELGIYQEDTDLRRVRVRCKDL